jgi:ABC-type Fe3+-hydroxamate transport system substrate-binding protein
MMEFKDQCHRLLRIDEFPPKRIISLVPSQTELLCDLGLGGFLIGRTKFCIHPQSQVTNITQIGGTKKLNIALIKELKPDLIIGNKEENVKEQIQKLEDFCPLWVSDVGTIEDDLDMIAQIGHICAREQIAQELILKKKSVLESIKNMFGFSEKKVLYLIWKNPIMSVGSDTYIHHVLEWIGLENCTSHLKRYPVLDEKQIQEMNPDYILLSSEPYPFKAKHLLEFTKLVPNSKVLLVDGEFFSWYGSRILHKTDYLNRLKKLI